jgi:hypothetical protein
MADHPEHPVVLQPTNPPATTTETESSPTSPVKAMKNWLRSKKSSKDKQGLTSLQSQIMQFVAPDGSKIDMTMLPENVAVFTTKNSANELTFNQEVGTKKSAKGNHFIAFTTLPELGAPTNRWILGSITEPSTSRKRAANTKFSENWHNFIFHKALNGPDDWQNLVGTGRAINLKLGTHWCIIKLNVPVTELDMSISSTECRTPANVISPTRQAPGTIQTEEEETEPDPARSDMIDLLYGGDNVLISSTPHRIGIHRTHIRPQNLSHQIVK